ncbi:LIM DOMAIN-BINDING PROTEIN [Salix koriyanagi]|uniref:LIM DOMAIN-BINDING PROTEIN n=2 Tax=Salix koriyanagi TaxID=2511006 RepID=A0A9Q0UPL5_9ROSI|nr:LIM DOMAIN-BINDING PROTEIN [Salix koriyanagi]
MIPSRPQTPIGRSQSVSPVLLTSNSAILGSQGDGSMLPGQYNMNLVGNSSSASSLISQGFGKGVSTSGLSGLESTITSMVANDVGFSSSFDGSNMVSSASSGKVQSKQISNPSDNHQPQVQQFESHMIKHGQKQFQSIRGGFGVMGPVKLEPQVINEQIAPQRRLQSMQSLGSVKVEPQQNQIGRGIGLENQLSVQSVLQQQQQFFQMSRQSPQAAVAQMNYLQQQQILQLQQQQQLLRAFPHQQPQIQQFQQQNLPVRSVGRSPYEPGTGARRLTQYIYQQRHRPQDNNIEFWRKFVAEYFASNARKRLCVSLYGNSRQTNGVFPQDLWHCGICNRKPGRGFETTVEVLPRLFKIKYDSGTLEELLYVDMPHEYQNASGQIVLDYAKAIQESVFEHLRVVRNGQLRIIFSPDLKICSWEFCACRHEELIPRRLIIPQVSQLGAVAQKYQASVQNASSSSSSPDLESNCNMFLASACQLAKALEIPLVNDIGYTKRYVRCLQISEVVNCMKDLIDYTTQDTRKGPIETLAQFPHKTRPFSGVHDSDQQPPEKKQCQITGHASNDDHHTVRASIMHPSTSSGGASANNSLGTSSTTSSVITAGGLLHKNSMNSRIENQMTNPGSPYTGTSVQIPSAGSSTTFPPAQPNPSSPFSCLTPSSSGNPSQSFHNTLAASTSINHISSANSPVQTPMQQSSQSNEVDPNEFQSSVEKIMQEMMISSQFSGAGGMVRADYEGNNMDINRATQSRKNVLTSSPYLEDNAMRNKSINGGEGFGNLNGKNHLSASTSGITADMGNVSGTLSGRFAMPVMDHDTGMNHQQQDLAYQLHNGIGAVYRYLDPQLDWTT